MNNSNLRHGKFGKIKGNKTGKAKPHTAAKSVSYNNIVTRYPARQNNPIPLHKTQPKNRHKVDFFTWKNKKSIQEAEKFL